MGLTGTAPSSMHKKRTHSGVEVSIDRITAHDLSSIAHTGTLPCTVAELIARVAGCGQIQLYFTRHGLKFIKRVDRNIR